MKILIPTTRFRRDLKRAKKRKWDLEKIDVVLKLLEGGKPLPIYSRPHILQGAWAGRWECHVESNWLLIYDITEKEVLLLRTGTHADLFE